MKMIRNLLLGLALLAGIGTTQCKAAPDKVYYGSESYYNLPPTQQSEVRKIFQMEVASKTAEREYEDFLPQGNPAYMRMKMWLNADGTSGETWLDMFGDTMSGPFASGGDGAYNFSSYLACEFYAIDCDQVAVEYLNPGPVFTGGASPSGIQYYTKLITSRTVRYRARIDDFVQTGGDGGEGWVLVLCTHWPYGQSMNSTNKVDQLILKTMTWDAWRILSINTVGIECAFTATGIVNGRLSFWPNF